MTQVQRKLFWFPLAFGVYFAVMMVLFQGSTGMSLWWMLTPLVLFVSYLAIHVKEQMAAPRATLMPGFRLPHLAVASAISFILVVSTTAWVSLSEELSPFAVFAVIISVFVMLVWILFRGSLHWVSLASLAAFGVFFTSARSWLASLLAGDMPVATTAILVSGLMALVVLGRHILKLNEDMIEYHTGFSVDPWRVQPWQERQNWRASRASGWESVLSFISGSSSFDRISGAGFWARAKLWRAGGSPIRPLIIALLVGSLIIFIISMIRSSMPFLFAADVGKSLRNWGNATTLAMAFLMVPLVNFAACVMWMRRLPRLGYESLRPAGRKQFIRELGLAFAFDLIEPWAVVMLLIGLFVAVFAPELFVSSKTWQMVCAIACFPFMVFAVSAWLSVYRSVGRLNFGLIIVFVMFQLYVLSFGYADHSLIPIGYYALTPIGGLVMIYVAYRKWCNADLE